MPILRIRETHATERGFQGTVSFRTDAGEREYAIALSDPFAGKEEADLEFFFERWLRSPTTGTAQADRARASIRRYGEALFERVFGERQAFSDYDKYLRDRLREVQIEIVGSPEFHGLHWETLSDPELAEPLAVTATMVRKQPDTIAPILPERKESPTLNLLVVTARPRGGLDVGYRTISRPLVEAIDSAKLPVAVTIARPGTWEALDKLLKNDYPAGHFHIIHFDLHGSLLTHAQFEYMTHLGAGDRLVFQSRGYGLPEMQPYEGYKAFLSFEGEEAGKSVLVEAAEVAALLEDRQIPICILNACQSAKQLTAKQSGSEEPATETSLGARLLQAGVQTVVAMSYSVTVTAARLMMETLYRSLFEKGDIAEAIRQGRRELLQNKARRAYWNIEIDLEDWMLPVVYSGGGQTQIKLRAFAPDEEERYWQTEENYISFKPPTYGFVGRDTDILLLERNLLRHNVLLLRGMGGTGKTTLLRYLAMWWQRTGFVLGTFYFGYDLKAWTLPQIVDEIARLVYPNDFEKFRTLSERARLAKLTRFLKSERYLLVLDNLESVTAEKLSVPNALPEAERSAIATFLRGLVGGKTMVVLGSRGAEMWLEPAYGENLLVLRGLDPESRSALAEKILARQVRDGQRIEAIRQDGAFEKLMALLAGYPLAMEVILANLKGQSPEEILRGLEAAAVDLDAASEDKTESVLRCIDYSHNNLSAEARELLLCLAPFSGFIDRADLENYGKRLAEQEALRGLPFDRLGEAVEEAVAWGLLASIAPEMPGLLSIQPTFPYFLKTKLAARDRAIRKAIREAFQNHYRGLSSSYTKLISSKNPDEKKLGVQFCRWEYENIATALSMALEQQEESFFEPYRCLNSYLAASGNQTEQFALARKVYEALKSQLASSVSEDFALKVLGVLDIVALGYLQTKQYAESRETYLETQKLLEELKKFPENVKQGLIASTYHCLGVVAQELREFEEARRNYQLALDIKIEFGDSPEERLRQRYSQASTYHQLGNIAYLLREFEEARCNYQLSLDIFIEFGDRYEQADTYHQLGSVAYLLREFEEARRNSQLALDIKIEFGDRYRQASTYGQLGLLAEAQKEYPEAQGVTRRLDSRLNQG